jgi:hypothetical protein
MTLEMFALLFMVKERIINKKQFDLLSCQDIVELLIEKILRHCGLWKETPTRAPPVELPVPPQQVAGPTLDFEFVVITVPQ